MNYYDVYEQNTHKHICALLATSFVEAWKFAESNGWHSDRYYIV